MHYAFVFLVFVNFFHCFFRINISFLIGHLIYRFGDVGPLMHITSGAFSQHCRRRGAILA